MLTVVMVWSGMGWGGVGWCGVEWGVVWAGEGRSAVSTGKRIHQFETGMCGAEVAMWWCGVVWCFVVWCGVVWYGVVWCGVLWCGVVWW